MHWLLFAVLNAFFEALKDVFGKISLKNIDEYVVSWALMAISSFFLFIVLLFTGIPSINQKFLLALLISGTINTVATVIYMKAIKSSDLSVTLPMLTFSPLFLLITSPLIVGEFPDLSGFIGVILIVAGAYLLNVSKMSQGFFTPVKMIFQEKGSRLMLFVAFIFSISANYDKIGVQNSSPFFWSFSINFFTMLLLLPLMLWKSREIKKQLGNYLLPMLATGFCMSLSIIFQMIALQFALVAYIISVKRTSTLFGVLFGYFIFKEKDLRSRLLGVIIMISGVLFITLK